MYRPALLLISGMLLAQGLIATLEGKPAGIALLVIAVALIAVLVGMKALGK